MNGKKFFNKYVLTVLTAFILLVQFFVVPVMAEEEDEETPLKLNAQSAVLMDGETGRILYGKEENLARPMASTTKIMTCILALEMGNLEDEVVVSSYAAGQPKVHLGAPSGRKFRLGDLLYSLMLESHNDSAVVIAEHLAGDVPSFARLMNQKAKEIGCENTWFITPNGLDAQETAENGDIKLHSTTASDLAAIMRYCTWNSPKHQEFLSITQTQNYYFTDLEGKGSYSCINHNAFLSMMDGVLSGKTGFTGGAGYSYVASLEREGRKYTIALLGCGWPPHKAYKWSDARTLFQYGLEKYSNQPLGEAPDLEAISVLDGIPLDGDISHGTKVSVAAVSRKGKEIPNVLVKKGEKLSVSLEVPKNLKAPIQKGEQVGKLIYKLDGIEIYQEPVCALENVERLSIWWCLEHVADDYLKLQGLFSWD